jgi:hypothetical protein
MFLFSLRRHGAWLVLAFGLLPQASDAHGIVGARFFPATITTDDPFAADELALPTITAFAHETDYDFDYSKSLFPGVAVSVGIGYSDSSPPNEARASGFSNLEITPVAELFRSPEHEMIVTAGFNWEIGGSGSKAVAERFSTYTPEILFGKGFGDLPDSLALLRPLAVTGQVGFKIAGARFASNAVAWGGALEYSLLYLENNVRDQHFGTFAARLTPIVEFAFESPTDAGGGGTTGTINPGLFWSGQYTQIAVEAVVPLNRNSGDTVGIKAQLHFYMDDIFPDSLGAPLFGRRP